MTRAGALVVAAVVASAVALAAVLCIEVPFLSNDGPAHAGSAFIHARIADPALGFARFYAANSPWSARGFDDVFRALEPLLGWRAAYQCTVVAAAELWALAFFAFVTALDRRRALVGLLGFPFALQTTMYIGVYPFVFGSAFGFFALAVYLRRRDVLGHVVVAALLFLCARCHVVAAGLTGLALGAVALAAGPPRTWSRSLLSLAAASLPALAVMFLTRGAVAEHAAPSVPMWPGLASRIFLVERGFQPRGVVRPLAALALAVAGAVACGRAVRSGTAKPAERGLLVVGTVFVVASMALPRDLASWQLANTRLLPLGTSALVALLAVERLPRRGGAAVALAVTAYALGSFASAALLHEEVAQAARPALAGLGKVKAEPRDWLPVIVEPFGAGHDDDWGIDGFVPLLHLGSLYAMELGGAVEYGQTELPAIHTALRTAPRHGETPPKELWLDVLRASPAARPDRARMLAAMAATREGVIWFGAPGDAALLEDAGFAPSFTASSSDGGLFIGAFAGCDATFTVDEPGRPRAHVDLEAGFWPRKTPFQTYGATLDDAGHATATVHGFACGEVWLDVPGRRCREAPPRGPVRARFSRAGPNTLRCTLDDDVDER